MPGALCSVARCPSPGPLGHWRLVRAVPALLRGPAQPGSARWNCGAGGAGSSPRPAGTARGRAAAGPEVRPAAAMPAPEAGSGRDRVMKLSAARFEAAKFQLRSKSLGFTCDFRMEYGKSVGGSRQCLC
ncbi:uncharacterized protein LOC106629950 [Zonotrichia albicollis]|uniref:uncharacterized protein LOC106629950 n=1 Tax=Zonotrichia albicollis TaxID=44394 RepID=UPI003D80BEDF